MINFDYFMQRYREIDNVFTAIKNYLPFCINTTESLDNYLNKLADVENFLESNDSCLLLLKIAAELQLDTFIANRLPETDTFQQFKISLIFYRISYQI